MKNEKMNEETYETLQKIKEIGKTFYSDMHVFKENFKEINEKQQQMECLFSIEDSLKRGLYPNDLENYEIQILERSYGEKWYLRFGFSKNDLPEYTNDETVYIGEDDTKRRIRNKYQGRKYSHTKKYK